MSPRKSLENYSSINNYILTNKEYIMNEDVITCTVCFKNIDFNPARGVFNIKKHTNSAKHQKLLQAKEIKDAVPTNYGNEELMRNSNSLIEFMTQMNYPLSDIDAVPFKNFAKKFLPFPIFSAGHYRTSVFPKLYAIKYEMLKDLLSNKPFYLIIDSTTDSMSRQILCMMIGECTAQTQREPYLLGAYEIKEGKADNYVAAVVRVICSFFGENINFENFKLLVTDQAPVMISAGKKLKETFTELKQVTCLAHLCHNIAEKIRSKASMVDKIVAYLKRMLIKNKAHNAIFLETTGMKPHKFPILIRWGIWIDFTTWLYDNYESVGEFIKKMDELNKTNLYSIYNSQEFELQIRLCKKHKWIPVVITKLEKRGLSTETQIEYLNEIIDGVKDSFLSEYVANSLTKNPDINFFVQFNELRCRRDEKIYSNAPLTSVEVERAFSLYRKIFDEQRQSLKIENLNQHLFLYYNKHLI